MMRDDRTAGAYILSLMLWSVSLLYAGVSYAQLSALDEYSAFGYGDGIRIIILGSKEKSTAAAPLIAQLSGDYIIDGEGYIVMPKFGRMNVIGLTPKRLEAELQEKLKPYDEDPIIIIIPLIRVTLLGKFTRPGSYRVDPGNSLWDVIKEAGGPSPDCNIEKMRIHRSGSIVRTNLFGSWEKGLSLHEIGIQSGDIVFAPALKKLTFRDFILYFQFAISILWLYLSTTRDKW